MGGSGPVDLIGLTFLEGM